MAQTITSTMRDIRDRTITSEIELSKAYAAEGIADPEIKAHIDSVFGAVTRSKTPQPKLQEGETLAEPSRTPKVNHDWQP